MHKKWKMAVPDVQDPGRRKIRKPEKRKFGKEACNMIVSLKWRH